MSVILSRSKYKVPKGGGTGSLHNHLKLKHPAIYAQLKEPTTTASENSNSILKFVQPNPTAKMETLTQETFQLKLISHVICSNQPFTLVEEVEFRKLLNYCLGSNSTTIKIPKSANTMKKWIEDFYVEQLSELQEEILQNTSRISFVIDCWTSSNQQPFQGVVANYIDSNWNLRTQVIDLTIMEGEHTGVNIAGSFAHVLDLFSLWDKLLSVTTDNASNMDTFFREFQKLCSTKNLPFLEKDCRVRCLAHIMNLACQDIITSADTETSAEEIESDDENDEDFNQNFSGTGAQAEEFLLEKLRKGVAGIRKSPQRREIFKMKCALAKLPIKTLILDVKTRWNSTFWMMHRCQELRIPYDATIKSVPKLKKYSLSDHEWARISDLVQLLNPFREATEMISNAHSPTLSSTSAVYQVLFDQLNQAVRNTTTRAVQQVDEENWYIKAIRAGQDKLHKYYPSADGLAYIISTGLT